MLKKILYVSPVPVDGQTGASRHVYYIVRELAKKENDIFLVAPKGKNVNILPENVKKYFIGIDVPNGKIRVLQDSINRFKKVLHILKNDKIDIAYIRYNYANLGLELLFKKYNIPYVVEVNTNMTEELKVKGKNIFAYWNEIYEPFVIRNSNGVLSISNEINKNLKEKSKKRNNIINFKLTYNGVDTNIIFIKNNKKEIRKKYGIPQSAPVFSFVGKLSPWHGLEYLVEALETEYLSDFYLWIIGSVTDQYKKKLFRSKASNRIIMTDWVDEIKLSNLVSATDIGVSSLSLNKNKMKEGQPLKTATYLACGLPTIISYYDPRLDDSTNDFVYNVNFSNSRELAKKIKNWWFKIRENKNIRYKARKYAEEKLSWIYIGKQTDKYLNEVINNHRGG